MIATVIGELEALKLKFIAEIMEIYFALKLIFSWFIHLFDYLFIYLSGMS